MGEENKKSAASTAAETITNHTSRTEPSAEASALEERRFLHDLASPLGIASGLVDMLLNDEEESGQLSATQKRRLEKALLALEKMKSLLRVRRTELTMKADSQEKDSPSKKAV